MVPLDKLPYTRENSQILVSINCFAAEFSNYLLIFFLAILTDN